MEKKIIHGNRNFGFAPIVTTGSNPSFGTPQMLPGMVSFDMEVSQESKPTYADNIVFFTTRGVKTRTATANLRFIPSAYAEYLGFKKNANGMVTDTGTTAPHCIFFETITEDVDTGETSQRLYYLYNVKGSEPKLSTETDEDEVSVESIEVEYSVDNSTFVADDDGELLQFSYIDRTEENKAIYDTFKTTVLLPTTAIGG